MLGEMADAQQNDGKYKNYQNAYLYLIFSRCLLKFYNYKSLIKKSRGQQIMPITTNNTFDEQHPVIIPHLSLIIITIIIINNNRLSYIFNEINYKIRYESLVNETMDVVKTLEVKAVCIQHKKCTLNFYGSLDRESFSEMSLFSPAELTSFVRNFVIPVVAGLLPVVVLYSVLSALGFGEKGIVAKSTASTLMALSAKTGYDPIRLKDIINAGSVVF